jgi:1,4-dihydroxy-2-naphthoate octaprenyltransferase
MTEMNGEIFWPWPFRLAAHEDSSDNRTYDIILLMVREASSLWNRMDHRKLLAIVRMSRPLILVAAVLANLAGLAMAYYDQGGVDWGVATLGMIIVLLATAMAHYLDEYADKDTDSLTTRTLLSGGSGVLPSGIVPPSWALIMAFLTGMSALLVTLWAFIDGILSSSYLYMFLAAMLLGYSYSMPPLQLARRGWGELDNAFLGTLMFFSGYLPQVGDISTTATIRSIPIFIAVLVNLIGTHWADRQADEQVGKVTLIVRLKGRSMILFPTLLVAMYAFVLLFLDVFPPTMLAAYLLTIPVAIWALIAFKRHGSPIPGSLFMVSVLVANIVGWSV